MRAHSATVMIVFGAAFWLAGTLWYQWRGPSIFETTGARYWANFILTPVVSTLVCFAVFRWQRVPASEWASAALLIAIPGVAGEAMLLSRFSAWMPKMQAASAGRYGALLFATYVVVLGVAEAVTWRAQ